LKICLVLEGSYPYVRGGVSTWVDSFIRGLPEHEFTLWTINDIEEKKGQFKYTIPFNVTEIRENFLSSSLDLRIRKYLNVKFTEDEREAFSQLIHRGNPDWGTLLESFYLQANKPVEFFISETFLELLKELCKEEFQFAGFKDLFWTIRSMYLPLMYLMGQPFPHADLYHSPSTGYAGVLAALASMKHNKPFVLTEHGIYTREREEELLRSDWIIPYFKELWVSTFYMFSRFVYQRAHRVTSLYTDASYLQQELGCPKDKCEVIGNGLDYLPFSKIPPKPKDAWIDIAAIVRFAPIKDIKTMIYTFSRLKREIRNVRLHILGGVEDEEYYQECLALIDYLDVKDILVAGSVEVVEYLEKIDFTLLTSISEGQPFAILESFAGKRPVVATDVGSCRELIEGREGDHYGPAGICVPPMYQSALLQALVEMCLNSEDRSKMGIAGHERVKNLYNHEFMINNYLKAYDKAILKWQESDLN